MPSSTFATSQSHQALDGAIEAEVDTEKDRTWISNAMSAVAVQSPSAGVKLREYGDCPDLPGMGDKRKSRRRGSTGSFWRKGRYGRRDGYRAQRASTPPLEFSLWELTHIPCAVCRTQKSHAAAPKRAGRRPADTAPSPKEKFNARERSSPPQNPRSKENTLQGLPPRPTLAVVVRRKIWAATMK